jgi:hypothetical protein
LKLQSDETLSNFALHFNLRRYEQGFGFRTISGSMPLNQRDKAIQAFQKDPPTTAGGSLRI